MTLDTVAPMSPADLRRARSDTPKTRTRDLADTLGVPEAALVAAHVDGTQVVRINPALDSLMPALQTLGDVMALTRNRSCVHERVGQYEDYHSGQHAAMVLGAEVDLRLFPKHWVHGFALTDGPRPSIQVFDAAGDAVHKVFLTEQSDTCSYKRLVQDLRLVDQTDTVQFHPREPVEAAKPRFDKADELRREWGKLSDTHQFLRLTSKLKMNRLGAYHVARAPWAFELPADTVIRLLHASAKQQIPLMVFVGNPGCIQIHCGTVARIEPMGPWINILDPRFNLHLRTDHIAEVWHVIKPVRDGMAHSIEAFDADGALIVQIFGKRKPDTAAFTALVEGLPRKTEG